MKAHWRKCPRKNCSLGVIWYGYTPWSSDCPTCGGLGKIRVRAKRKAKKR